MDFDRWTIFLSIYGLISIAALVGVLLLRGDE